ncbi:HD-GYP domain-containing protein [Bacillus luteolus]|uniref:HD-GYP domain-containing protein n=1 Tax=Litchfieldia luteola TaxID=682179 RepID=A0ABR9QFX8_9BACI|nr:HD-GYP domain-containing protein [Cytobacillus luteolus]MBE4907397.1 HD-GYP domain-containing protein [Cytobacillus luteolus]MBP1944163.1 putative nucleotidyltransferase with HDIG domain [Cytobacillus luteolus]
MILVSTKSLAPGKILAKAIYNENGQVLISEDVPLTERMIVRLLELGITFVYVKDNRTEDIETVQPIPRTLRKEAIKTIETIFIDLQKEKHSSGSLFLEKNSKHLLKVIRSVVHEVKNNKDLITLLSEVYTYDNYIFTHSLNVTLYTLAIGTQLKMSEKQLEILGIGAILHDVGKMTVPIDILMKPGRLTLEEFETIKLHTEHGFEILRRMPTVPLVAAHCAFQHHERIDGSGYPRGIKGPEIHEFAKVMAVADVFDAVTSNRVYRSAMLPHEGLEILYSGVGNLFDTKIVEAFRKAVVIYPVGLTVYLNDGRKGIVSKQNQGLSERPVIRILEESGRDLENPYEVDLKQKLDLVITKCDTTLVGENLSTNQ